MATEIRNDESDGRPRKKSSGIGAGQGMMLMRMLRLLRILRLVKMVRAVRPLYNLVMGMCASLQGIFWVLVLSITVLYALGIVATRLVGHGMLFPGGEAPEIVAGPFATVPDSMFTLFRYMSSLPSAEEAQAVDELMHRVPVVRFSFVFFMVTSSWTLLSILTAVVSDSLITTTAKQEAELRLACAEEDREEHTHELCALFQVIDVGGKGNVTPDDLEDFLKHKDNSLNCARMCRVNVRDVKDVLNTLMLQSDEVTISQFVEGVLDMSKPAQEKSVKRLEAKINILESKVCEMIGELGGAVESIQKEIRLAVVNMTTEYRKGFDSPLGSPHSGSAARRRESMPNLIGGGQLVQSHADEAHRTSQSAQGDTGASGKVLDPADAGPRSPGPRGASAAQASGQRPPDSDRSSKHSLAFIQVQDGPLSPARSGAGTPASAPSGTLGPMPREHSWGGPEQSMALSSSFDVTPTTMSLKASLNSILSAQASAIHESVGNVSTVAGAARSSSHPMGTAVGPSSSNAIAEQCAALQGALKQVDGQLTAAFQSMAISPPPAPHNPVSAAAEPITSAVPVVVPNQGADGVSHPNARQDARLFGGHPWFRGRRQRFAKSGPFLEQPDDFSLWDLCGVEFSASRLS